MRIKVTKLVVMAALMNVAALSSVAQTIKAQISFPQPVAGIAANPATNRIYVVAPSFGGTTDTLAVIDGKADKVVANISIPVGAYLPAVNILTNRIYVASCNSFVDPVPCFVTVVDGWKNKVIATIPVTMTQGGGLQGIAVNPLTGRVYVANASDNVINIIDGQKNTVVDQIALAEDSPSWLALNPFNGRLYVPFGANQVEVIDSRKKTVIATTTVGDTDEIAAVNLVTGNVFVTDLLFGPSTTAVLDQSGNILASVPVGDSPYGVDVDPITNLAFVVSTALNNVTVIDGKTNTVKATVPGIQANFVAVNLGSQKVYLSGNAGVIVISEK